MSMCLSVRFNPTFNPTVCPDIPRRHDPPAATVRLGWAHVQNDTSLLLCPRPLRRQNASLRVDLDSCLS